MFMDKDYYIKIQYSVLRTGITEHGDSNVINLFIKNSFFDFLRLNSVLYTVSVQYYVQTQLQTQFSLFLQTWYFLA